MSKFSFVSDFLKPDFKLLCIVFLLTLIAWGGVPFHDSQPPVVRVKSHNVIDLGRIQGGCNNDDPLLYPMGAIAFNHSPELMPVMAYLKHKYKLTTAVETGTFEGNTTSALSLLFDAVHSIEISPGSYRYSLEHLSDRAHVHLYLGDSKQMLPRILSKLKDEAVLVYLDAHWGSNWPILDELKGVGQTHKDRCVIVVDDALVPGYEDIGYDSFEGKPLSYDFVKNALAEVFTQHEVLYLVPKNPIGRGKMVLMPKLNPKEQLS